MFYDRVDSGIDASSIPKDEQIELNKGMSKIFSEVRATIKSDKCFYCGQQVGSFCKSHYVPRFCLENISNTGEVTGFNAILGLPKMGHSSTKHKPGIGESGVFDIICHNCDNTIFHDYENPDNYAIGKTPSPQMLAQIAIKNYLKFIYKRKVEIALAEKSIEKLEQEGIFNPLLSMKLRAKLDTSKLDLSCYINKFKEAKKYKETGKGNGFYLIYYRLLDYVTPIAMQSPLTVSIDLEGNVINDVFNMNPNYIPTDLHLCVLPQKASTAIVLFTDYGDRRYSKFGRQLKKLSDDEQLGVINYLIFLYCEDYFLSEDISSKIDLNLFNDIANLTPTVLDTKPVTDTKVLADRFSLSNWNCIPNLLEEKYKFR